MQRRSHEEVYELIEARKADFINGDASEDVLLASLKALGLDREERRLELWKAQQEKAR
jgi:hypothetical protein